MAQRVERPTAQAGYDLWADSYDQTPNPIVAADRIFTPSLFGSWPRQVVLDAGCGTGGLVSSLAQAGARTVGIDLSRGMLRVARRRAPAALLAQADLNGRFPVPAGRFDTVVSSLVSEHLSSLRNFFLEAYSALRRGGLLVFSSFHPALASSGVEANFSSGDTEYRLGAARHTISDYLNHISESGFSEISQFERIANDELLSRVPDLSKFEGMPVLFQVVARRAT